MPNQKLRKLIKGMCYLCMDIEKDALKYGEFMVQDDIGVHYYCLLLSSCLIQNGKDNQGFLGFLRVDIKKEAKRVRRQKCCYCHQLSANIGCCDSKCRKIFHLTCGIQNGAQNQFIDTFRSFCHSHVRKYLRVSMPLGQNCIICMEKFDIIRKITEQIRLPCCKNGWFHKLCMQEYADSAGYFLKCPLCNDSDYFATKLQYSGIFISLKDAKWELEPDAYVELLDRPNMCIAERCLCPHGRESRDTKNFELIYCSICGSVAQHKRCNKKKTSFTCAECKGILSDYQNKINSRCIRADSIMDIDNDDEEIKVGSTIKATSLNEIVDSVRKLEDIIKEPVIDVEEYDSVSTRLKDFFRNIE